MDLLNPGHDNCHHQAFFMTCGQYEHLLARANGSCEMCGLPGFENHAGRLHIDHDYSVGAWAVRGLLCRDCNTNMDRQPISRVHAYLDRPWFLAVLQAYGIEFGNYPDPPLYAVVYGPGQRRWKHYKRGLVRTDAYARHDLPGSWDRLTYQYGPHNLTWAGKQPVDRIGAAR